MELTADLIKQIKTMKVNSDTVVNFTVREIECFIYWIHRYSAKEISAKLGISHRTVETHICRVRIKFGCSNRLEAIQKIASLPIKGTLEALFCSLNKNPYERKHKSH